MGNSPRVSVCIPTYKRVDLLKETIRSAVRQDLRPLEIIVGDDSPDPLDPAILEQLVNDEEVSIAYRHHTPSKGQAANVNSLFDRASADWLVLIHDDDLLLPNAIDRMVEAAEQHDGVQLVFGTQRMISHEGDDLGDEAARSCNERYHRGPDSYGRQASPLASGLLRQIPNNGYLVRTEAARRIGYRDESIVGYACDTDFGIRLGAALPPDSALLIPDATSAYRLSNQSILRDGQAMAASYIYDVIEQLEVPPADEPVRAATLADYARGAVREHSLRGNHARAREVWRRYAEYGIAPKSRAIDRLWMLAPGTLRFVRRKLRQSIGR